jgi:hypothetical protein
VVCLKKSRLGDFEKPRHRRQNILAYAPKCAQFKPD